LSGKAPWDPKGKSTLLRHVVAVGCGQRRNERKKVARRKRPHVAAELSRNVHEANPSQEEVYADVEERARLFEALSAACEGDAEACAVLDAELQGVRGVEAQAGHCKMPVKVVENARDRIGRRLRAIEREEQEKEDEEAS
jgi:hypothetical protein